MAWFSFEWLKRGRPEPDLGAAREVELPGIGPVSVKTTVDCRGDACPRPQLLTMKALNQVLDGEVVEVISDNPSSVEAIPAMMLVLYSTHLATVKEPGGWRVYVRKGL